MWEDMQKKCAIFSQISTANAPNKSSIERRFIFLFTKLT